MSKGKTSIMLRRFGKFLVITTRTSRYIEALLWKHIRKTRKTSDENIHYFWSFPTKVTVAIRFSSIILLVALMVLFFLVNSQMQFGKMILEKYQTFLNYTIMLLLLLRNIMVICYKDFLIEDWNHSNHNSAYSKSILIKSN